MAITLPSLANADMDVLIAAGKDGDTGVNYIAQGVQPSGVDPHYWAQYTDQIKRINRVLAAHIGGGVTAAHKTGASLDVIVFGLPRYKIGATTYTLADEVFTCTDGATCYLYVDEDEVVEESITGWPATPHFKLAVVTTASGAIADIAPALAENHPIGSTDVWSQIPADQDVDMAGFDVDSIGFRNYDGDEATVSTGVLMPTSEVMVVRGEGDAADVIDTIEPPASAAFRVLMLRKHPATASLLLVETGNVVILNDAVALLDDDSEWAGFLYDPVQTKWIQFLSTAATPAFWEFSVDANNNRAFNLRMLTHHSQAITLDAAGGCNGVLRNMVEVDTFAGAASDDMTYLAFVSDVTDNASDNFVLVCLRTASSSRTVVMKHDAVAFAYKMLLANGRDFPMSTTEHRLLLLVDIAGGVAYEVARSPMTLTDLVDTGDVIPIQPRFHVAGALSAANGVETYYAARAFTLVDAAGVVVTAPSGGPCYVDVQVNSGGGFASIFANDAERIHITDGNTSDVSATKNHAVAVGDLIRIAVLSTATSPNGAENLTVTLNGLVSAKE